VAIMMLQIQWYVCTQDHFLEITYYLGGSVDIMVASGGIYLHV
jgi:hypothetical protein